MDVLFGHLNMQWGLGGSAHLKGRIKQSSFEQDSMPSCLHGSSCFCAKLSVFIVDSFIAWHVIPSQVHLSTELNISSAAATFDISARSHCRCECRLVVAVVSADIDTSKGIYSSNFSNTHLIT